MFGNKSPETRVLLNLVSVASVPARRQQSCDLQKNMEEKGNLGHMDNENREDLAFCLY